MAWLRPEVASSQSENSSIVQMRVLYTSVQRALVPNTWKLENEQQNAARRARVCVCTLSSHISIHQFKRIIQQKIHCRTLSKLWFYC